MPTQSLFAKWSLWLRHAAPVLLLVTLSLIAGCQGGCSGESQHGYTEAVPDFYIAHLEANNAIWYHPNNGYSHNPGELTIAGLPSGSAVTELVAIAPERFIGLTTLYMVVNPMKRSGAIATSSVTALPEGKPAMVSSPGLCEYPLLGWYQMALLASRCAI